MIEGRLKSAEQRKADLYASEMARVNYESIPAFREREKLAARFARDQAEIRANSEREPNDHSDEGYFSKGTENFISCSAFLFIAVLIGGLIILAIIGSHNH